MTGLPPSKLGSDQVNPIYVEVVNDGVFRRFRGGFGTVTIIAPPPTEEIPELP